MGGLTGTSLPKALSAHTIATLNECVSKMKLPVSGREAQTGNATCLGLSNGARGPFVRKLSIPERDLLYAVAAAEDIQQALKGATWTSLQVN